MNFQQASHRFRHPGLLCTAATLAIGLASPTRTMAASADPLGTPPRVPAFSLDYMDLSAEPGRDFYRFANGKWATNNPIPADKARWAAFSELAERNWFLTHAILVEMAANSDTRPTGPERQVGDFFRSAMDTARIEQLQFKPIADDLARIESVQSIRELCATIASLHERGVGGFFDEAVSPDAKNSAIYAFELSQGGLALPDRDYYLKENFAAQRDAYRAHVSRMFVLLGEPKGEADVHAITVLDIETALARASRTRVELRDPNKNYNKLGAAELAKITPHLAWSAYFTEAGLKAVAAPNNAPTEPTPARPVLAELPYQIVGQPEFFGSLDKLLAERPLSDWKTYLRWHLLHSSAPYLHSAVEQENFAFFGKILSGQEEQEPRWKRAAKTIDRTIGEALGQLYVQRHFPPEAKARMQSLVENLKIVFRERLQKLDWMTDATKVKALAKFERFTQKIGHPDKFRDYSALDIRPDDYLGNARRAAAFETHRQLVRIARPVDKTEWHMTPGTVNAYFNPLQNEIVFPAGILQPPFFDLSMDDAVNYGGIGAVIGHEITHGYDDEGRKFDADGNLNEWWTEADAKAFDARAQQLVDQYNAYEPLPGLHVNGKLTLGENIADLGGATIAFDALQRALAKDPSKRKTIDGFTPEQRFFLSWAQVWRVNIREPEQRRLITVDPHSPGRFRAVGPLANLEPFCQAFQMAPGSPMCLSNDRRVKIW